MSASWTRRHFIIAASGPLLLSCGGARTSAPSGSRIAHSGDSLVDIEARVGGRLGVYAVDTASGRQLAHRADERFAMCSTFKWVLAAAVLERVDRGALSLSERVNYTSADLLEYAPVTSAQVAEGSMTIEALAHAAVAVSDNTAANLLLAKVDGPSGLTRFVRSAGDPITRLDRYEPALNSNDPGDVRDTTSPRAMVGLMRQLLCGETLTVDSRQRLLSWLRASETGKNRIRGGLPGDWVVGDKTGSCMRNAINDVAIAVPPGRAPVLVAVYTSGAALELKAMEAAHAEVGKLVARTL